MWFLTATVAAVVGVVVIVVVGELVIVGIAILAVFVVAIVVAAVAEAGAHRSASDSRPLPRGFAAFRLRFRLTGLTPAGKAKKNLQGIGQRSWQRTGRAAKCEEDKHLGGQWWRCTSEHRIIFLIIHRISAFQRLPSWPL